MRHIIITFILLIILYWYFNIRGLKKCITIQQECNKINQINFDV